MRFARLVIASFCLAACTARPSVDASLDASLDHADGAQDAQDAQRDVVAMDQVIDGAHDDAAQDADVIDDSRRDVAAVVDAADGGCGTEGACGPGRECVADRCARAEWAQLVDPQLFDGLAGTSDGAMVLLGRLTVPPFRHGAIELTRSGPTGTELFLAQWARDGAPERARVIARDTGVPAARIARAPDGGLYFAFELNGPSRFNDVDLSPRGPRDVVLARLDRTLAIVRTRVFSGPGTDSLSGLAQTATGAVLTLYTDAPIDVGPAILPAIAPGTVVLSLDDALTTVAARGLTSAGPSGSATLAVRSASSGALYATGDFQGSFDFGAGAIDTADPPRTAAWIGLNSALSTAFSAPLRQPACGLGAVRAVDPVSLAGDRVAVLVQSGCALSLGGRTVTARGITDAQVFFGDATGAVSAARTYGGAGTDTAATPVATRDGVVVPVSVDGPRGADFGGGIVTSRLRALALVSADTTGTYRRHRVINGDGSSQPMLSAQGPDDSVFLLVQTDVTDTVLGVPVFVAGEFGRYVVLRAQP